MDRFEAMSYLVASAEAGSFSAAGRQLGVPLPTISRKIGELEARLNAQLLVRSTRRLSLTDVRGRGISGGNVSVSLLSQCGVVSVYSNSKECRSLLDFSADTGSKSPYFSDAR